MSKSLTGWRLHMLSGGYATKTVDNYLPQMQRVIDWLGDPEADDVTVWDLEGFLTELRETGVSEATRQAYWRSIRSYFKWAALKKGLGIPRPDTELQMPCVPEPEIQPYTEQEIQALLKACSYTALSRETERRPSRYERPTADRDRLIILMLLDTGVRVSELCRIRFRDVDLDERSVVIRPFETGKKSRSRTVYVGATTAALLWKLSAENEDPDNYLFASSRRNKPLDRYAVKNLLERLGKKAGIPDCGAHRFRHTFAVQYLRNGGDIYTLKRLIGHSSFRMVQRYLQLSEADSKRAHRKASPVDNWV